jgi:hypothetical protein
LFTSQVEIVKSELKIAKLNLTALTPREAAGLLFFNTRALSRDEVDPSQTQPDKSIIELLERHEGLLACKGIPGRILRFAADLKKRNLEEAKTTVVLTDQIFKSGFATQRSLKTPVEVEKAADFTSLIKTMRQEMFSKDAAAERSRKRSREDKARRRQTFTSSDPIEQRHSRRRAKKLIIDSEELANADERVVKDPNQLILATFGALRSKEAN